MISPTTRSSANLYSSPRQYSYSNLTIVIWEKEENALCCFWTELPLSLPLIWDLPYDCKMNLLGGDVVSGCNNWMTEVVVQYWVPVVFLVRSGAPPVPI